LTHIIIFKWHIKWHRNTLASALISSCSRKWHAKYFFYGNVSNFILWSPQRQQNRELEAKELGLSLESLLSRIRQVLSLHSEQKEAQSSRQKRQKTRTRRKRNKDLGARILWTVYQALRI
jgi:hypothetical protein